LGIRPELSLGQAPVLLANIIRLGWDGLPGTDTLAYAYCEH